MKNKKKHKCCFCKTKIAVWLDRKCRFKGMFFCNDCHEKLYSNEINELQEDLAYNEKGFDICQDENVFFISKTEINNCFNDTCVFLPYYDIFDISNAIDKIYEENKHKNTTNIVYNVFMSKLGTFIKKMKTSDGLTIKGLDNIDRFFYNFKKELSEKKFI